MDLFQGKTEEQALEETADYFTRITDAFEPLPEDTVIKPERRVIEDLECYQVAAKL